ncbi:hypothetical protein PL321_11665 [Caloramator sp. mosi_1]|uniref:hypothetical protein n=1 Tax=Caloramator sp. mosi_1 TaxID=3023090 RepID=UPI0023618572|nr:hypothetical protein [Caloramator sp. mosi_1]WDC83400.1 hypothetical protein PL321_11665 [Caloramator sp. mosi_1]
MKKIIILKLLVASIVGILFVLLMQIEKFREMRGFIVFVFVMIGYVFNYYLKKKFLN